MLRVRQESALWGSPGPTRQACGQPCEERPRQGLGQWRVSSHSARGHLLMPCCLSTVMGFLVAPLFARRSSVGGDSLDTKPVSHLPACDRCLINVGSTEQGFLEPLGAWTQGEDPGPGSPASPSQSALCGHRPVAPSPGWGWDWDCEPRPLLRVK